MSRLTRDGTAEPVSRDQFSGANADREIFIFPVQLTTSRIGNHTRLIHTLAICVTIHAYAPGSHIQLSNNCLCPLLFCLFFLFLWGSSLFSFSKYQVKKRYHVSLPFSLCTENYVVRFFSFWIVFFYLVTTSWILTSACLCENSTNQSEEQIVKQITEKHNSFSQIIPVTSHKRDHARLKNYPNTAQSSFPPHQYEYPVLYPLGKFTF